MLAVAAAVVVALVVLRVVSDGRGARRGLTDTTDTRSGPRWKEQTDRPATESARTAPNTAADAPARGNARTERGTGGEPAAFVDVTESAGIRFVHACGAGGDYYIPEQIGPGGGFLDYDRDGDLDVFLVQSGVLGDPSGRFHSVLYRNDGGGRFRDVTKESNIRVTGYGMGCACADVDNDGDVDIFVTCLGPNVMLRNNGDGTFTDITARAGVGHDGFGASAAFLDYDRDGRLDLYVTNYVDWSLSAEHPCFSPRGLRDYCGPLDYGNGTADVLYHNLGDARFEDVSATSGIASERGNGLGVLCSDFDNNGLVDIYVANDQTPAFLWMNTGNGRFENQAATRGCAFSGDGVLIAGMGVASEDVDADGDFDLIVTNIRDQPHLGLRNDGGFFEDVSWAWGLAGPSVPVTGFGIVSVDHDHDGDSGLFIAAGAVNLAREPRDPDHPYAEPNQFLDRTGRGVFRDLGHTIGPALQRLDISRGAIRGDYDGDGDVDILITNNRGPARLLRNECRNDNAWVMIDAVSRFGGRAAIGARVEVQAGGRTLVRLVRPNESYLCSSDPRAHFGVGPATRIDQVTITWPEGDAERWTGLGVRQVHRLMQGTGRAVRRQP
ncbi:MAG: CRTAC1 family protein [Phycisphaerae bacterium]